MNYKNEYIFISILSVVSIYSMETINFSNNLDKNFSQISNFMNKADGGSLDSKDYKDAYDVIKGVNCLLPEQTRDQLVNFLEKKDNNFKDTVIDLKCLILEKLIDFSLIENEKLKCLIEKVGAVQSLNPKIIEKCFELLGMLNQLLDEDQLKTLLNHNEKKIKKYYFNVIIKHLNKFFTERSVRLIKENKATPQLLENFFTDVSHIAIALKKYIKDNKNLFTIYLYMNLYQKIYNLAGREGLNEQVWKNTANITEFENAIIANYNRIINFLTQEKRANFYSVTPLQFASSRDYITALFRIIDEFRIPGGHSYRWYSIACNRSYEFAGIPTAETDLKINNTIESLLKQHSKTIYELYSQIK